MAKNQYKSSIEDVTKELYKQLDTYKAIDAEILKISKNARTTVNSNFSSAMPKDVNERLKTNVQYNEQLNSTLKEQDRLEKALISAISKKNLASESTNKALVKQRYETQQINKENKRQAVLTSDLSTAYQKLSTELLIMKDRSKALQAQRLKGVKLTKDEISELKRLEKQIPKVDKGLKNIDASVGNFQRNVGGYAQGIKSVFTSLIGAFGIVEGLRLGLSFAQESVQLARDAKGVEFAFEKVEDKTNDAYAALERIKRSTRGLLSDFQIKKAIVELDNFNINAKEADVLLEFLAVRSSQTGQSIDKLRDSLIEGLSKESKLRIDNLGISASELNAELEKTPNFVQAVANIAKKEIAEAGDILDEAANSQEKFNAALEDFQISAGSGFIGTFVNEIYGLGTAFLSALSDINDASDGFWDFLTNSFRALDSVQAGLIKAEATVQRELAKRPPLIKKILDRNKELGATELALAVQKKQLLELNSKELLEILKAIKVKEKEVKVNEDNVESKKEDKRETKTLTDALVNYRTELERLVKVEEDRRQRSLDLIEPFDDSVVGESVLAANYKAKDDLEEENEKLREQEEAIAAVQNALGNLAGEFGISAEHFKALWDGIDEGFEDASDAIRAFGDIFLDVLNTNVQAQRDATDAQLEVLERGRERELSLAGDSAADRERIEIEYDRKVAELKNKQLEREKQAAIYGAVINTAVGVVEALPNIPLSIAVGVLGAAQIALIASQPIPEYKDGHLSGTHEGLAKINDASGGNYQEIVQRKDGTLQMYSDRNQIIKMNKGDKVHKAGTFNNSMLSYDDLVRNTIAMSVIDQNQTLTNSQQQQVLSVDIGDQIERQMSNAIGKMENYKSQPFDYNKMANANRIANKAHLV